MSTNIIIAVVACIFMVSAVQAHYLEDSSVVVSRTKREAVSPPLEWVGTTQHCCPNVPILLNPESTEGCEGEGDHSCQIQCAFKKQSGMVTAAEIIDYTAVGVSLAKLVAANNVTWTPALNTAYADCNIAPIPLAPENHNCKSGAAQLNYCMLRNTYLKCPLGVKNTSDECTKKLSNIPNWGR